MRVTIAAYRFKVIHIPGKENIADTLSRLTDQHTKSCAKLCAETEEYVRFVAENATACALPTREIERAAAIDKELSNIRECIQKGQWETLDKKRYLMVRSKLSLIGKLVLRLVASTKFGGQIVTRMLKDSVSHALLAKWFQCRRHHQNYSREQSSHQVHGNISQQIL